MAAPPPPLPPRAGPWSYRGTIGSSSQGTSRTSGTILSTTYGTSTRGSDDLLVREVSWRCDVMGLSLWSDEERKKLVSLVDEFCVAADGTNIAVVLQRWFWELDVGWLFDDDLSSEASGAGAGSFARRWIRALGEIAGSIRYLSSSFSQLSPSPSTEQPIPIQDPVKIARFTEAAMSIMLPFVDAIVAPFLNATNGAPAPPDALQALIRVGEALHTASQDIQLQFSLTSSAEARRIIDEISKLTRAQIGKLDKAVWNTIEDVMIRILAPTNDSSSGDGDWGSGNLQGSTDVHKLIRSVITYIEILFSDAWSLEQIVRGAAKIGKYVLRSEDLSPLTSLATDMLTCLEDKLQTMSSFPDEGLRLLFLLNNTHFMWLHLQGILPLELHKQVLQTKMDDYIQTYLQVSWGPVLSCLQDPGLLCLGRYSPLPKFESKFLKVYTTQKLCKVPDLELRKRLRKAIIDKVTYGFTKYMEDNKIRPKKLGVGSNDLKELLGQLFEG